MILANTELREEIVVQFMDGKQMPLPNGHAYLAEYLSQSHPLTLGNVIAVNARCVFCSNM